MIVRKITKRLAFGCYVKDCKWYPPHGKAWEVKGNDGRFSFAKLVAKTKFRWYYWEFYPRWWDD